jgi:hypothetical protein
VTASGIRSSTSLGVDDMDDTCTRLLTRGPGEVPLKD